jgi:DNA-binding MarR family transcriptional regulator
MAYDWLVDRFDAAMGKRGLARWRLKAALYMHMQEDEMIVDKSVDAPPAPIASPAEAMIGELDCREVAGCACLALRRIGRMATQVFDAHLQTSGLTIGQFGIMTQVYGSSLSRPPLTMKELSSAIGMDPTTLNRTLKPLEAQGLISTAPDPRDRRVRCIHLTLLGRERLAQATPLWRAADDELRRIVGAEITLALQGLLALAGERLRTPD